MKNVTNLKNFEYQKMVDKYGVQLCEDLSTKDLIMELAFRYGLNLDDTDDLEDFILKLVIENEERNYRRIFG
jgi:hypothetical protein